MMRTEYAEAPVVGRSLRGGIFATATSSGGEAEIQDAATTSGVAPYPGRELIFALIPYARYSYSLPYHSGVAVLYEGSAEQVGLFEDAVVTSSLGPYANIRETWNAFWRPHARSHRRFLPSPASAEELLDWDFAIQAPPPRLSGTISVSLKYMGRSVPTPVPDPGDE